VEEVARRTREEAGVTVRRERRVDHEQGCGHAEREHGVMHQVGAAPVSVRLLLHSEAVSVLGSSDARVPPVPARAHSRSACSR
jgi:hypothetical protein